jgi:hypothetical protein
MVQKVKRFTAVQNGKNQEIVISLKATGSNFLRRRPHQKGVESFAYEISDADYKKLLSIAKDSASLTVIDGKPAVWVGGLNTTGQVKVQQSTSTKSVFFTNIVDEKTASIKAAFYIQEQRRNKVTELIAAAAINSELKKQIECAGISDEDKQKILKEMGLI